MEFTWELLTQLLQAAERLLLQPFYYIGILIIILQYRRQIVLERKLFHTRLHSIGNEVWRMLLWGWASGIAGSLVMAFVGTSIPMGSLYMLWVVSLILTIFRVRYLNIAYSAGILGLLHSVIVFFPVLLEQTSILWLIEPLQRLDVPSLLVVVAVLHLIESVLIRTQGVRLASPTVLEGKRGKKVGGYQLQSFWPVPLFLLMPVTGGALDLPWTPWFASSLDAASSGSGWTFFALPVVLGFTEFTQTRLPADKIRHSSSLLMFYGCFILISAVLSYFVNVFIGFASLLSILLLEAVVKWSEWQEASKSPLFVHNEQGLKILAVLPGSAASELGLTAGEIIHKVNLIPVHTKQELHQAMQQNSAFCRLEVINLEGYSKFVSKAIYAGDHHQLGIILAPDAETLDYVEESQKHLHFLHPLRRASKRKEHTIYEEN
jgi:hypothetical protein